MLGSNGWLSVCLGLWNLSCALLQSVWDITWMSGQAHALGQVDGCTWTSDSHAPGQVPSQTDHLVKCHSRFEGPDRFKTRSKAVKISKVYQISIWPSGIWRHSAKWYPRLVMKCYTGRRHKYLHQTASHSNFIRHLGVICGVFEQERLDIILATLYS